MTEDKLLDFAQRYAEAWCSQNPESVAEFFSADGSLKVNDSEPASGKEAITRVAGSFMDAFPDMIVSLDKLQSSSAGVEFHWTLKGTNTGSGGKGNKIIISGIELWQFDKDGFIRESIGSFDEAEYMRQIEEGEG